MKKNRLLFAVLLFLSLVFVYYHGGNIPYRFFYMLISVFLFSLFYVFLLHKTLTYRIQLDKALYIKEDGATMEIHLHNKSILLYPYVRIQLYTTVPDYSLPMQSFSLLPFQKKTICEQVPCSFRGKYQVGVRSVQVEDFFGIFRLINKKLQFQELLIYPKIHILERMALRSRLVSESQVVGKSMYEDMSLVSDIRQYAQGDHYKRIHWKLSAKKNELMIKEFESTAVADLILAIDLREPTGDRRKKLQMEDKLIECMTAVVQYCLSHYLPIRILYHEKEIVSVGAQNPVDFEPVYRWLAEVPFEQNIPISQLLPIYLDQNIQSTDLLVFTLMPDRELYETLCKARLAGHEVGLIYVQDPTAEGVEDMMDVLKEIQVLVYKVQLEKKIKNILES